MDSSITIKITYDDLSKACKARIQKLEKELGCTVDLVYPTAVSNQFDTGGSWSDLVAVNECISNAHLNSCHGWRDQIVKERCWLTPAYPASLSC